MILYRDIQFIKSGLVGLLLSKVIVQCLSQQRMALAFGGRFPADVGEQLVDDAVRLHRSFDFLRAGVVPFSTAFEVIIKRFELVDVVFAEPDTRRCWRVSHASRLAGQSLKLGGNR